MFYCFLFYSCFGSLAQLIGWLACVQLIEIALFFVVGLLCGGRQKNVRDLQVVGQVLFVDVLNFVGVLFILVIELQLFLVILTSVCFCVCCLDLVLFCCFTLLLHGALGWL